MNAIIVALTDLIEYAFSKSFRSTGERGIARTWVLLAAVVLVGAIGLYFSAHRSYAHPGNLDWTQYGKDLANTRFQDVDQINPSNVAKLKVAWVFHTGVLDPQAELETSPIKVKNMLYVTDGHDDVFALDAETGEQKWAYKPTEIPNEMPPLDEVFVCCGRNNRGVVFIPAKAKDEDQNENSQASSSEERNDRPDLVVYGRLDDVVVALNAKTGAVVWKSRVVDFHSRAAINMAPQFSDGLVIVGLAGGEYEIRGQVIALHAGTGQVAWRFHTTLPETYADNSWQRGGAPVW